MIKKISVSVLVLIAVMMSAPDANALSARGFALVEAETGRLINGQNTGVRLPMASTTKIMTGLLACESGKLDTFFTVPEAAILVEGSSIGLVANEKLTLRDLTYGLLLESGNDAANVIAYLLGGSIQGFAEMMNKRATELGLTNTHFDNPSGLDGKTHYTTALDLARLGAVAMKNKDFSEMASTYTKRIPYNGIKDGRLLKNHNELLKTYDGTIGIKTGYTKKSGRCLVTCAERNGVRLVVATLNGWDDWGDHRTLLDYGFTNLKRLPLEMPKQELYVGVTGGTAEKVKCAACDDASAVLKSDELQRVKSRVEIPESIGAPVEKEQKMGEVIFTLDGAEVARVNIVAIDPVAVVEKKGFFRNLIDFFK